MGLDGCDVGGWYRFVRALKRRLGHYTSPEGLISVLEDACRRRAGPSGHG